ncbi:hypothetical protein I6J18_01495 [Peribacillus psychrosaccharolyticus]|uniref:Uncharacterized protein n=1 Tax=Peribacillus psychrosaccharolyticus TaxID=1407 RepID=A0A974S0M6_PERPY|nr:hypothetical protein [Peribacillus psychrosaccharolyticus]MEC2056170.1 hypothetical protein [Peribacillus psychrosaccharolyticus]MED3743574.1 hypothetical protein [Peribacillus psychrosaccharolyticus]QQT00641.1 hypothetical protein I6J18_01495 [Peribacillus psychrosaccharolyticus]
MSMVSMGKLPNNRPIERAEIELMSSFFAEILKKDKEENALSSEALELLSTMLCERASAVIKKPGDGLILLEIGSQYITKKFIGKAQYPNFILELLSEGLVYSKADLIEIIDEGEKLISELVQITETYRKRK